MRAEIRFFRDRTSAFTRDFIAATEAARRADDQEALDRLYGLLFDHVETGLKEKDGDALIAYLDERQVWREWRDAPVFKTVNTPCIAYTAHIVGDKAVVLTVLGACYAYPNGSQDDWWDLVIRPRVKSLYTEEPDVSSYVN